MNLPVRAAADLRLLRAAMFSAVCVALSAGGHALASGAAVSWWCLAAGWAGITAVAGALAGRERSLPGIALTLLAGEIGLHLLFCLGQKPMTTLATARSASVSAMAERLVCGRQGAPLTPRDAARLLQQAGIVPPGSLSTLHSSGGLPGVLMSAGTTGMSRHGVLTMLGSMLTPSMLAAHVTALVITGWVLRRCEIAVWQAVRQPAVAAGRLRGFILLRRLGSALAAVRHPLPATGLLERILAVLAGHRRAEDGTARRFRSVVLSTCVARRGPPVPAWVA